MQEGVLVAGPERSKISFRSFFYVNVRRSSAALAKLLVSRLLPAADFLSNLLKEASSSSSLHLDGCNPAYSASSAASSALSGCRPLVGICSETAASDGTVRSKEGHGISVWKLGCGPPSWHVGAAMLLLSSPARCFQ